MTTHDEGFKGMKQSLDVVEVKSSGRLVKDEERRRLFFLADEISQLDTLVLTTGEGAGVLTQFDVAETYFLQRFQTAHDDAAG